MKRFIILAGLIILLFLVLVWIPGTSLSLAEIPRLINYQGMLTGDTGEPLDGDFTLFFRLYNAPSGGDKRWEENHSLVSVSKGLFNVILGSQSGGIELDFSEHYWLEIQVENDTMPERLQFTSVGYAYRAQNADTAAYAAAVAEGDLDTRYVNVNGPDSVTGSSSDPLLRVWNSGTGDAIRIEPAGGAGIEIEGISGAGIGISEGDIGIRITGVYGHGIAVGPIGGDGIYMDDINGDGIDMDWIGGDGIAMGWILGNGIYMGDIDSHGVYIDSVKGYDGVHIDYAADDGIEVAQANYGLYVSEADAYGVLAYGDMGNALHSEGDSHYGLLVSSNNYAADKPGLYVYGYGQITGTWTTRLSASSGDEHAFMVSSRDVELIASGTGSLVDGQAQITFEPEFQEAVSTEVPVRVVVTPQDAPSALLYVTNKSTQGFTVKPLEIPELSLKTDNVSFDWIAIARQKGYEQRPEIITPSEDQMRGKKVEK